MTAAAPLAPAGDLLVQAGQRVVSTGEEFTFDVTLATKPSARLGQFELVFPGFAVTAPVAVRPEGGVRLRGQLRQPGLHALKVSAVVGGRRLTGRDYFAGRETPPVAAAHEAGYYVFLGCGDYALIFGRETHPLAGWTPSGRSWSRGWGRMA